MPFEARRYISAPITLAAGPLSMVSTGRFFISLMSITPPSPRIIIKGTSMPAWRTLCSVEVAVFIILGRMLPLMAAVRVRRVRPYSLEISEATLTSRPCFSAMSRTSSSSLMLSTPKALLATITCAPSACSFWMAASTVCSFTSFSLIKV